MVNALSCEKKMLKVWAGVMRRGLLVENDTLKWKTDWYRVKNVMQWEEKLSRGNITALQYVPVMWIVITLYYEKGMKPTNPLSLSRHCTLSHPPIKDWLILMWKRHIIYGDNKLLYKRSTVGEEQSLYSVSFYIQIHGTEIPMLVYLFVN